MKNVKKNILFIENHSQKYFPFAMSFFNLKRLGGGDYQAEAQGNDVSMPSRITRQRGSLF